MNLDRKYWKTALVIALLAYFAFYRVFSGVCFYVLAAAFLPGHAAPLLACIAADSGSWLIGFFSIISPAGLGFREGAMTYMLHASMSIAYTLDMSLASRLMMMAAEIGSVALASVVFYVKLRLRPASKPHPRWILSPRNR